MKKVLIAVVLLLLLMTVSVGAAQVGDKIGEAVFSDITAYINNYPIPSYVINNYAVIVAEDLTNYGCDVVYDNSTRTLNITKAVTENQFNVPVMYKTSMETGAYFTDVLYTDIKTYVNGNEVTSFNVNGKTMIVIDQFGKYMDGYAWNNNNRSAQAWIAGKPTAEYKPLTKRTEKLFEVQEFDYSIENYTYWHDFDFDGSNEKIDIQTVSSDYGVEMTIAIGGYYKTIIIDGCIEEIYVCDIDLTDGVKDLVLITNECSDDPLVRIMRFDEELTQYVFKYVYEDWDGVYRHDETDAPGTGYVDSHYFNVNDDGTITLKEQTPSMGMWHVYRTYKRNYEGKFEEIVPAYYDVLPDHMQQRLVWDEELRGYERDMWEKGYIKAYCKYHGDGIVLNKGDYFRVLYDNGKDYIYVEKTNGQAGWIYIAWDTTELNAPYFMCAG